MQRWKDYGKRLLFIGTLGEYVDFAKLPAALQKEKLATVLGSKASSNVDDLDACGSPGEAASEPTLGHHYSPPADGNKATPAGAAFAYGREENQRTMPHNNVALRGKGQLRQRTAWALSQIFMLGWAYRPG